MLDQVKFLGLISGLAILVAACSNGTQSVTNPAAPPAADTAANVSTTTPAAPQATTAVVNIASLGVQDISQIKFQTAPPTVLNGFFDAVNESGMQKHSVNKTDTITLSGWAIIPEKNKTAEKVIITLPNSNQVVGIANVNLARPDVAKAVNSEAYKNAGWTTSIKANTLPTGRVLLTAWAYDPATRTATQLRNTHELTVSQ